MLNTYKKNNFRVSNEDISDLPLIVTSLEYTEDGKEVILSILDLFDSITRERLINDEELKSLTELKVDEYEPKYFHKSRSYKLTINFNRWVPSNLDYSSNKPLSTKFIYNITSIDNMD